MTNDVVLMPLIPIVAMIFFFLVNYDIREEDAIAALIIGAGTSAWAYFVLALAFVTLDPSTSYTILALLAACIVITMLLCWLKKWSSV